ncbi:MAG: HAMP domain-containing sensor histidine kinase [Candidatus Nealsonbacteria bacterium]
MTFREILEQLNLKKQCRKYGLSLWQCPQFLFLLMGIVIIFSSLTTYAIGTKYIEDPYIVALAVIFTTLILLIIATTISKNFERLAETNKMKSEFVNVVSHQLRSPLSNLKWALEFIMNSSESKDISKKHLEYINILKENTDRMSELVSDLLTVSRIEQGKLPTSIEKVSLGKIVQKIIKEVEIFIKASNATIFLKIDDNLPEISLDISQIKLAIENVLDNAIRYSDEKGKINIKINKKDNYLYLEIKDSGVGIPSSDQKYIFQKFFRSGNALRHKTEGSGLGLYIAKSIVEKNGGKLKFKSEEGKGSTFWFILPIK